MIVKVPIYVEIDSISADSVPYVVRELNENFTKIVRKNKLTKIQMLGPSGEKRESIELKVITREKAEDFLRTSK